MSNEVSVLNRALDVAASGNRRLIDENVRLRAEHKEWLAANAPGGWIDELRQHAKMAVAYKQENARLEAELAALREDRDHNYQNWLHALDRNQELLDELDALRKEADKFGDGIDWIQRALQAEAELAVLREQKPVAYRLDYAPNLTSIGALRFFGADDLESAKARVRSGGAQIVPLYAAPGAQPAVSVPDLHLRSRVADLLHLLNFAEICTPSHGDKEQAQKVMQDIAAMLAAAPEAKP